MVLPVAALAPWWPVRAAEVSAADAFPGWPAEFEGWALRELPLTDREAAFARAMDGRVGRFSDGRREIILRWVPHPTRRLHPAGDCFRGMGYAVAPRPIWADIQGRQWGSFTARRGDDRLIVREHIRDAAGRTWTDVSAWYWAATLGRSQGPWWAVTVAEREEEERG